MADQVECVVQNVGRLFKSRNVVKNRRGVEAVEANCGAE